MLNGRAKWRHVWSKWGIVSGKTETLLNVRQCVRCGFTQIKRG